MVAGQLVDVDNHIVRGITIRGATKSALALLGGFAGIENFGGAHHVDKTALAARKTNDAAKWADDVRVHRANRTNRAHRRRLG